MAAAPSSSSNISEATTVRVAGGGPYRRSRFIEHLDDAFTMAWEIRADDKTPADDKIPELELPPPSIPLDASNASSVYSRSVGGSPTAVLESAADRMATKTPASAPSDRSATCATTSLCRRVSLRGARQGLRATANSVRARLAAAIDLDSAEEKTRLIGSRQLPTEVRVEKPVKNHKRNVGITSPRLVAFGPNRRAVRVYVPLVPSVEEQESE